jgi:hypothetical protein
MTETTERTPPAPRPVVDAPELEAEAPTAGPLIMLASDDADLCVDDACVPPGSEA